MAARNAIEGVALLVADGKPAQAVGIGGEVSPGVSLKEVHPLYVLLSDSGVLRRVELPDAAKMGKNEGVSYAPPQDAPQPPGGSRMTGPQTPIPLGANPNIAPQEPPQQPQQPIQPPQSGMTQQPPGMPPPPNGGQNKI